MFRIAVVVWIMAAVTLAGIALLVVLTVPSLNADAAFYLPIACGVAAVIAMPISYILASRIRSARAA